MVRRITSIGGRFGLLISIAAIASVSWSGCSYYLQQHREYKAQLKAADEAVDRARIAIYTGNNIPYPYKTLGKLDYTVAFSPEAIDSDHIKDKLRRMAIAKWGTKVDALINQGSRMSKDASRVTVFADGVEITGACSFCRHSRPPIPSRTDIPHSN